MRGVVVRAAGSRRRSVPALVLALSLLGGCSLFATRGGEPAEPTPEPTPGALPRLAPVEVPPAAGATRPATRIERVSVESEPGGTRVVLDLDGFAEPEVSLLVNQRLVIDVPGTTCQSLPRELPVTGDPLVERVRIGQHAAPEVKSRVVIDLRDRADFAVRAQNGRIVVLLAPGSSGAAAAVEESPAQQVLLRAEPSSPPATDAQPHAAAASPAPLASATPTRELVVEPTGAVAVVASPAPSPTAAATPLPAEATPLAATPLARVELPATPGATSAPLPNALESAATSTPPLAVLASPRPVDTATPAPIEAAPTATSELEPTPLVQRSADVAAVEEENPPPGGTAAPERTPSTQGKRISIDFTETDVRTVIELIASAGGYQVIFTPDVAGVITVTLVDRPWEDALQTVLRAKMLREVRHEDLMLVSPAGHASTGKHHAAP